MLAANLATNNGIDPMLSGAAGGAAAGAASGAAAGFLAGGILLFLIIMLVLQCFTWLGLWTASSKAGYFGLWACLPIVQCFIFALMAGKPVWWGLLFFIPFVNIVIVVIVMWEIVKRFDRGIGTFLGLWFLPFVFWPILGLGSARYNQNPA